MKLRALRLAYFLGLASALAAPFLVARPAFAQEEEEDDDDDAVDEDADVEEESARDADPSALTVYRDELAPHGTWVVDATYGTVWVPSSAAVGPDFAPYVTSGHWELTDDGDWLWVSDYSWGYIPFHYGRWVWTSGHGWAWIPGRVYSHAWVVWRVGAGGYIGWAPMAPSWYWYDGVAVVLYAPPPSAYVFCHGDHVFHHHVHSYVVRDRAEVRRAAAATRPQARGRAYTPASPTLKQANVDEKSAPKSRTRPDDKALKFDPKARNANSSAGAGGTATRKPNTGTHDAAPASARLGKSTGRRANAEAPSRTVRTGTRSLGETPSFDAKPPRDRSATERTRDGVAGTPEVSRSKRGAPSSSAKPATNANDGARSPKRSTRIETPSSPSRSATPSFGSSRTPSFSNTPRVNPQPSVSAPTVKPLPRSTPKSVRRGRR